MKFKETKKSKADMSVIKGIYDLIKNKEVMFGELSVQNMIAVILQDFGAMKETVKIKDLPKRFVPPEGETKEEETRALMIMKDLTVNEAVGYLNALANAIDQHKYKILDKKTVGDLGIKLLSEEKND